MVRCTLITLPTYPSIGALLSRGDPNLLDLRSATAGTCAHLRRRLRLLYTVARGRRSTLLLPLNVGHVHDLGEDFLMVACAAR